MMSKSIPTILLCLCFACGAYAQLPVTDGLIVHLRADSLAGLRDGDPVAAWLDSAQDDSVDGSVFDVASGTPIYKTDVLFGKPVVRFNGAEALSSAQFDIDPAAGATCFLVCTGDKSGVLHERVGHFGAWDAVGGTLISLDVCTQQGTPQGSGFRLNNGWSLAGNPNPMTTGFHVGAWQATQGTLQSNLVFYLDGVKQTLTQNNPNNTVTFQAAGNVVAVGDGHSPGGTFYSGDFYTGDVAAFIIYNRVLSEAEVMTMTNYLRSEYLEHRFAISPAPASGASIDSTLTTLAWEAGQGAVSHQVYLSANEQDVIDANPSALIATTAVPTLVVGVPGQALPEGLTPGMTYHWRVDEVAQDGTVTAGAVWTFMVPPTTVYAPTPADGGGFVLPGQELTWKPGLGALLHTVYFGTDADAVAQATGGVPQSKTSYTPAALEAGKTYYWRVDEFTTAGTVTGPVWSFTTLSDIPVQDASLLGWWTMDQVGAASVIDVSGHGRHGTVQGTLEWIDGVAGAAAVLTEDDLITIPPVNATLSVLTMTGWIEPARVHARTGIVFMRSGALTTGINLMPSNQLGYHWLDVPESWQYASGLVAAVDEWSFVGMVVTPDKATFYLNTVEVARELPRLHDPVNFSGNLTLGSDTLDTARRYVGALDDLRFYNRALTAAEVTGIINAGVRPEPPADPMVVEDFDAYNAYAGEEGENVWDVWADGLGGNGTGSTAGYAFEPIMSRVFTVGGGQALPVGYDNTGSFVDLDGKPAARLVSEVSRDFSPAQDLTRNGAAVLTLWVRGDPANTAQAADSLYLVVRDTAGKEASAVLGSPADLLKPYWQRKTVALSALTGVDLTRITGITLGIGNQTAPQAGGHGTILVDNIMPAVE